MLAFPLYSEDSVIDATQSFTIGGWFDPDNSTDPIALYYGGIRIGF